MRASAAGLLALSAAAQGLDPRCGVDWGSANSCVGSRQTCTGDADCSTAGEKCFAGMSQACAYSPPAPTGFPTTAEGRPCTAGGDAGTGVASPGAGGNDPLVQNILDTYGEVINDGAMFGLPGAGCVSGAQPTSTSQKLCKYSWQNLVDAINHYNAGKSGVAKFLETTGSDDVRTQMMTLVAFLANIEHETAHWSACKERVMNADHSCPAHALGLGGGCSGGALGHYSSALAASNGWTVTTCAGKTAPGQGCKDFWGRTVSPATSCWFGRGPIQTSWPGNYAALQADWQSIMNIDVCDDPDSICSDTVPYAAWVSAIVFWKNNEAPWRTTNKVFMNTVSQIVRPADTSSNPARQAAFDSWMATADTVAGGGGGGGGTALCPAGYTCNSPCLGQATSCAGTCTTGPATPMAPVTQSPTTAAPVNAPVTASPTTKAPTNFPVSPVATPPASAGCLQCWAKGEMCYVASWGVPCYITEVSKQSQCAGEWCGVPPVTPAPAPTPPPPQATADHTHRLVAYLANWKACPSDQAMAIYTHIFVSFATTYTNPGASSGGCVVGRPVLPCTGGDDATVARWRGLGKKVIISIGGWNMNGHWNSCFGKEESLATQMAAIADDQGFDGVDVDFEQDATGGNFLSILTNKLREKMPGKEVTHAPMDSDLTAGHPYTEQLKLCAHSLDFIFVQYYNGITRPNVPGVGYSGTGSCANCVSAQGHYDYLLDNVFGGDASKLVFGFCVTDCSGQGSNVDATQVAVVMNELYAAHPSHGGVGFWEISFDVNGQQAVGHAMNNILTQKRDGGGGHTTPSPTTQAPVTSSPTTQAPQTEAPVTAAPTTAAPTTPSPTTPSPTTPSPTTQVPHTAPVTDSPTTAAPVTDAPTTAAPVTAAPATLSPTTHAPQTPSPTTQAPTTPPPHATPVAGSCINLLRLDQCEGSASTWDICQGTGGWWECHCAAWCQANRGDTTGADACSGCGMGRGPEPTDFATADPVTPPTAFPTGSPPTDFPTKKPTTSAPTTEAPTRFPTDPPTDAPATAPTHFPTEVPPTHFPTDAQVNPTGFPTTKAPTHFPTTEVPTRFPTPAPTTQAPTTGSGAGGCTCKFGEPGCAATQWAQCGGPGFTSLCCEEGYTCCGSQWWASCQPTDPSSDSGCAGHNPTLYSAAAAREDATAGLGGATGVVIAAIAGVALGAVGLFVALKKTGRVATPGGSMEGSSSMKGATAMLGGTAASADSPRGVYEKGAVADV